MKRVLLTFVKFLISPGTEPISEVKDEEFERKDLSCAYRKQTQIRFGNVLTPKSHQAL